MNLAADLILTNANLITLNPRLRRATALAIRGERILAVGDDRGITALASPHTRRIDLAGKTVVPGFIDSHIHMLWYGLQLRQEADLVGSTSVDDVLSRLAALAKRGEEWIRGHGFDQDKLKEKRFPTREELDKVSRTRPIIISRICGHAVV